MINCGIKRSTTFIFSLCLVCDMNSSESCCFLCKIQEMFEVRHQGEHLYSHSQQHPVKAYYITVKLNYTFDTGMLVYTSYCREANTRQQNSTLKGSVSQFTEEWQSHF